MIRCRLSPVPPRCAPTPVRACPGRRAAGLLHRLSGQRAVTFRRSAAKSTSTGDSSPRDVGRGGERRADRSRPGGKRGHYPFAGVHDDLGARQGLDFLAADHEGPAEHLPCVLVAQLDRVVAVEVVRAGRKRSRAVRSAGRPATRSTTKATSVAPLRPAPATGSRPLVRELFLSAGNRRANLHFFALRDRSRAMFGGCRSLLRLEEDVCAGCLCPTGKKRFARNDAPLLCETCKSHYYRRIEDFVDVLFATRFCPPGVFKNRCSLRIPPPVATRPVPCADSAGRAVPSAL